MIGIGCSGDKSNPNSFAALAVRFPTIAVASLISGSLSLSILIVLRIFSLH
ncbi:MAG: hypothetical protein P8Y23_12500 [Candidatus Lokiarchaeota archaeon]